MRLPLVLVAALVIAPLPGSPGRADDKDKNKRSKAKTTEKSENRDRRARNQRAEKVERVVEKKFGVRDRDYARSYWYGRYGHRSCPPGLYRSGRYCYYQGWTRKRYTVGYPLDHTIFVEPVPPVFLTHLGPAPVGYRYGIVDGDVVLLALGTLLVVDAIDHLVD